MVGEFIQMHIIVIVSVNRGCCVVVCRNPPHHHTAPPCPQSCLPVASSLRHHSSLTSLQHDRFCPTSPLRVDALFVRRWLVSLYFTVPVFMGPEPAGANATYPQSLTYLIQVLGSGPLLGRGDSSNNLFSYRHSLIMFRSGWLVGIIDRAKLKEILFRASWV